MSPTVATGLAPQGAGTDSPLIESEEIARRPSPGRNRNRKPGFIERNRDDLLKYLLTAVVGGGLLAALGFAFLLNREIGEIQNGHKGATRDIEDLRGRINRTDERMERNANEQRSALEKLRDDIRRRFR